MKHALFLDKFLHILASDLPVVLLLLLLLLPPATATHAARDMVTVAVPAAAPPREPQWETAKVFTSAVLNSTNFYRRAHNASDVQWNQTLSDFASAYLLRGRGGRGGCRFGHSGGPYGENLAEGYADVTSSVEAWGGEAAGYDYGRAEFSPGTGHFTQLVWKDTTDVGCARRLCGRRGWYLACEYWPRGNVEGRFAEEVDREVSGGRRQRGSASLLLVVVLLSSLSLSLSSSSSSLLL
ncbi:hypothetical protein E4U21_001134 [Claviceps maximensis]|nr:hypothetical protein E4U21_001134 [Claviceps maximensis]